MSNVGTYDGVRFSSSENDEISIGQIFDVLWDRRLTFILIVLLCTASAVTMAFLMPKQYEAKVLILPSTDRGGSNGMGGALSSAVSQLGGLASIVGLSASTGSSAKAEALATLQSEVLMDEFIKENNLLPILFSKEWDPQLRKWKTTDPEKVPTLWKGNRRFEEIRTVTETAKTGLVTLKITWTDPRQAAAWANGLVEMTNRFLRDKAIAESERNIAYLQEQLNKTNVVELRTAIYNLMESEIKREMVARGSDEYALKIVDPAVVPEMKSSPKVAFWAAGGFAGGLLITVAWALARVESAAGADLKSMRQGTQHDLGSVIRKQ